MIFFVKACVGISFSDLQEFFPQFRFGGIFFPGIFACTFLLFSIPTPPPPHHFFNGPSFRKEIRFSFELHVYKHIGVGVIVVILLTGVCQREGTFLLS